MKTIAAVLTSVFAFILVVSPGNGPTAMIGHSSDHAPVEKGGRSGARAALEFWTAARAYPGSDIPAGKFAQAALQSRRMMKLPPRAAAAGGGWSWMGPSNLSGRMISLACNPLNGNTLWAGSASGGLWRSGTGGTGGDWVRISTGYPVLGVGAIAIPPSDSNTIYIGTGEVYRYEGAFGGLSIRTTRGSYGMGILKSTDGGLTWSKSLDWSFNEQRGVEAIRINPLNPNTVWAATTDGIYKTTDAGASWTNLIAVHLVEDIVIHATDTNRVLASMGNFGNGTAMFKSWDGGATWFDVTFSLKSGKLLLEPYASNPDVVYASVADSGIDGVPNGQVWRSTDFGASWLLLSTHTVTGVQGWYSHYVAVHPSDSTQVVHGGVNMGKSTNGGTTFSGSSGTYSDHHAYAHDPGNPDILYDANDDGVYRSTDFGATFTKVSTGLNTGQFYNGFSNSATDSLLALCQAQDHIPGYLYQGSLGWTWGGTDEAGWTAIDPSNDSYLYAVSRWGGSVRRSTNRGASWSTGGVFGAFGAWNSPVVVAPSSPNILYFGDTKIYKSFANGTSWVVTNSGAPLDGNPCLCLAVAPDDANTVYAGTVPESGTRGHIFRTTDGGVTWADVTGTLPDRYPLDLAVDPNDGQTVYVAFGGYNAGHIFRSTNGGSTWTNITGSLPDIPVTALLLDPLLPGVLYVGTDLGVQLSTNSGSTWYTFSDGLPEAVLVSDLSMTPSNRTMRVATHGNGAYQRRMPVLFPSLALDTPNGGESWESGSTHLIEWSRTLVAAVRIEASTDDGATWQLVHDSIGGSQSSYAWTLPLAQTSAARIRVTSRSDTTLRDVSNAPFTIFFNGTVASYRTNWNMVSVPVDAPDRSFAALFPSAIGGAFAYSGTYELKDSLEVGRGYWVKLPHGGPYGFAGSGAALETVAVSPGWNLVGSLAADISAGSLSTLPAGILGEHVFGYDGSYQETNVLRGGQGYWVYASGSGLLMLSSAPQEPQAIASPPEGDFLQFSDRQGRRQRLYLLGNLAEAATAGYLLPPTPPKGGFDIRFADGRFAAGITGDGSLAIALMGVEYPLLVEWNAASPSPVYSLAGDGLQVSLSGSGSTSISEEQARGLRVQAGATAAGDLPRALALAQNYPNPFNPATVIRYALPEPGRVTITIYDATGALVRTILDGEQNAGDHQVRWDASGSPSGLYVCRLQAGGLSIVRKMILAK